MAWDPKQVVVEQVNQQDKAGKTVARFAVHWSGIDAVASADSEDEANEKAAQLRAAIAFDPNETRTAILHRFIRLASEPRPAGEPRSGPELDSL